jgi:hypothetical protein
MATVVSFRLPRDILDALKGKRVELGPKDEIDLMVRLLIEDLLAEEK